MSLKILYEDNHLIAVFKPAGVLTQGDKTGDPNLLDEVRDYLKNKYHKPGNVFVGMLHRLDRPVEGIILFSKTSKGASRLSEQFRNRTVRKTYQCLVLKSPNPLRGTLNNYILKDKVINKSKIVKEDEGGEPVELSYETVKTNKSYSLLKVLLKTGKSHQIRSQLANVGCPIVGDIKYGAPSPLKDKSIALIASELRFNTATTGEAVSLSILCPKEWDELIK
ncbi:MAG: RluA family pseudouridine synthase [bacterium]